MKRKTGIMLAVGFLALLPPPPAPAQGFFGADRPNDRLGLLWNAPTPLEDYVREINAYIAKGETDKAEARIREALIETKNNPELLVLAGHVFTAKRQFFIAEDYWALLAAQFPSNAWAQACWGGMLLRVERWEQAEEVLAAARRIDPKELVARYNLACSRLRSGDALPLWMLEGLTTDEIGRIATWIGSEQDVLVEMLKEDGYRTLCRAVLTGDIGVKGAMAPTKPPDLAALNRQMNDVAAAIWQAHQAKERQDWPAIFRNLERAKTLGATAPAIRDDIERYRSLTAPAGSENP